MARYRLYTTEYVLKGPKKAIKCALISQKKYSINFVRPPPFRLPTFWKLVKLTFRGFLNPPGGPPPPSHRLSTFEDPPYPQKMDNLPFFWNPSLI